MTMRYNVVAGQDNSDGTKPLFALVSVWTAIAAEYTGSYNGRGDAQDYVGRMILSKAQGDPDTGAWITFPREQANAILRRAGVSY